MARVKPNYDSIDPMDGRYFNQDVANILSERAVVKYQAQVEAALAQTLADFKVCSAAVAKNITSAAAKVSVEEVYAEEAVTKHNIKALVNVIKSKSATTAGPYVHFGATSYDIVSTAQTLQYQDAIRQLIIPKLAALLKILATKASQYANTAQIGRTHGQHAVPITFGFALSGYLNRLGQSAEAVVSLAADLKGKFSGATGSYNALSLFVNDPLRFEKALLAKLNLQPASASTQIAPPEPIIRLLDELTISAGVMANLATDLRHLQRTEIAEIRESFEPGQTGSSTMAHKRNPISFENVASLYKQVLGQQAAAQLNLVSEHQRDLTDSASSRFYPILLACVAAMADRLSGSIEKLVVDETALQTNLKLSSGAIAAEPLYLLLAKNGHPQAHEKAKELAIEAQDIGMSLVDVIQNDPEANEFWKKLSPSQQKTISHPERYYIGQAAKKAQALVKYWKPRIKHLS